MFRIFSTYAEARLSEADLIGSERKKILDRLAAYILGKQQKLEETRLVFICTHNSRRSHFGQIFSALASEHFGLKRIQSYSGGTESTRVHPHTVAALERIGFLVKQSGKAENPNYEFYYSNEQKVQCFSKRYDHPTNPKDQFAAIMTCSEAEQNCPLVAGAEFRLALPYDDPGKHDGTSEQDIQYNACRDIIARELFYVYFSVKKQLHD